MASVDLATTPAAKVPPGMVSNLENPFIRDQTVGILLGCIGLGVSTMFLTMRIYTKAVLAHIFGIDHVFLLASWIMSMMVQVTIIYYKSLGMIGRHVWDMSLLDLKRLVFITTLCSIVYLAVMACAKFSILIFYMRLSPQRWFKNAVYATMTLTATFTTVLTVLLIFACIPLKRVWNPLITDGHCINRGNVFMATAGINAATDIIMLILPMPMLIKLQVPRIQKIGLMLIFSVGSVTMATSVARLHLMPPLIKNLDMPWALSTPSTWILIEGSLVIICGSLPILRLFLKHTCPRLIGEAKIYGTGRSKPTGNSQGGAAELSNLERQKAGRSKRYSRMTDFTHGEALIGTEHNGSDTYIGEDKEMVRVHTEQLEQVRPARPYSQTYSEPGVPRRPPPGHVEPPTEAILDH